MPRDHKEGKRCVMGDLIERQAAIELADTLKDDVTDDERIADAVIAHNEGILEYQTALSLLPSAQQNCTDCPEYDHETHSCPKYCNVIQKTLEESQPEIDEILNYLDTELHPLVSPERWDVYATLYDMISLLHKQPERETGTWIIDSGYPQHCWCSNCNHRFDLFDPKSIHFCPNCGKEMKTCVWKSQDERRQE